MVILFFKSESRDMNTAKEHGKNLDSVQYISSCKHEPFDALKDR